MCVCVCVCVCVCFCVFMRALRTQSGSSQDALPFPSTASPAVRLRPPRDETRSRHALWINGRRPHGLATPRAAENSDNMAH